MLGVTEHLSCVKIGHFSRLSFWRKWALGEPTKLIDSCRFKKTLHWTVVQNAAQQNVEVPELCAELF